MTDIVTKITRQNVDRKEELEKLSSSLPEDIVKHLEDAIISTNIIVNGFTLGEGFHSDGKNIMFVGVLELRDSLVDAIEWIRVNVLHEEIEIFKTDQENISYKGSYEEDDEEGNL